MPLRNADRLTAGEVVAALRDRHGKYLRSVKVEQLQRLVELIQKHAKDPKPTPVPKQLGNPALETIVKETSGATPPPLCKPLTLLPLAGKKTEEEASATKSYASVAATNTSGVSGAARPVPAFAHKSPAVESLAASTSAPLGADWNATQKMPAVLAPLPIARATTLRSVAGPVVDVTKDLNKVSDDELKRAKQAMNADFEKNRLKPGDKGFSYDVQKSFGSPTDSNDWDEDSDISLPKLANPVTTTTQHKDADSLDKSRDQAPAANAASATAKAWLRSTPASTGDKNSASSVAAKAGKGAWAADENSIDELLLSDDEDLGVEAEIQRIEREQSVAESGSGKNETDDQDAEDEGSKVEQSAAVDRTSWQPPTAAANTGQGLSKLAPLGGGPSGAGLTSLTAGGLVPIRTVPALEKLSNDENTSPANPGKLVVAPVVSATTPAPVSALTTLGGDDAAAGSNDPGDEISEEIEEYILESDGDGEDDEGDSAVIPPAAVNLTKTPPAPAPAPAAAAAAHLSSSSLGGLPPLQGMATAKPAGKPPQDDLKSHEDEANDEHDDDDFGAGHTDDEVAAEEDEDDKILVDDGSGEDDDDAEIVFSDDGLSYDEKDDDGGF
ncbi:Centrosomal protein of 19 kDa [Geranomyces variabilis]|uniref:Centrosomal protein of 19 kDa n=1 Tax=Geranomyces variabilis TaxID=109894 RepID=A0AAD5XLH7_9FUNG|nr:Centrosomal protein of 19 kDa [Geranomyces variabilis]